MKLWYIWGLYLPVLLIEADSFDKALEEARRINPNYNTGQLRETIHSQRIYYGMYANIPFDYLEPSARKIRKCMTKQEFINLARKNGVQNDSTNVWVVVDGYQYTTSIKYVLEYEEPFEVPDILNSLDVSLAWDDLYEQYCCREGIKIC